MRAVLDVASLEISRRILLFPAALVTGLMPFVVNPLLEVPRDHVLLIGLAGSLVMVLVVGAILGASVIAADLGAGRLSFFFSRPLAGATIFAGKVLAALLLALSSGLLAALPVHVFNQTLAERPYSTSLARAPLLLGLALLTILGAHLLGVIVRARSPWLILDTALFTLSVWWLDDLLTGLGWFSNWMLIYPDLTPFTRLVFFLVAVLLVTGLVQVLVGRTDLARSHRAASLTFWPLFLVLPAGLALYLGWIRGSGPGDISEVWSLRPSSDGRHLFVAGPARGGRLASFLLDTETGAVRAPGAARQAAIRMGYSDDGAHGALLSAADEGRRIELRMADLRAPGQGGKTVVLSPPPLPLFRSRVSVAPGGRHVVLLDPGLRVYETRTGGATLNVPDEVGQPFVAVRFLEGERILAYRASPSGIEVLEASLGGGPISSRGRVDMALPFDLKLHPPRLRFDLREERVLIGAGSPPRFLLAPALGGSALRELETPPDAVAAEAAFLPEGGFVLAQALPRTSTLRFFADDGRPSGELDLARAARRLEVKAMGGGRVGVALRTSTWAESRLLVVDTGTRRVVREEEGLAFADAPAAPAGRPLLEGTGPSLVRYDVETGERRLLWSRASAR